MIETCEIVIIGGGQGGLSLSRELAHRDREHVILERGRVGQGWRDRWDSFCLVLPNWTVRLAGQQYDGEDPDGFMGRDVVVDYISDYATSFGAPVREGVSVECVDRDTNGGFVVRTSAGNIRAGEVVVATGGYQRPYRPPCVADLPGSVLVLDAVDYRNPGGLPPGKILVIGSGQTGCQIAEELNLAGRDVVLACGKTPWLPRRIADRDVVSWLVDMRFMDMTLGDLPSPMARLAPGPQTTGAAGGHDLHYRTLVASGVTLAGRMLGVENDRIHFADDLTESVAFGDARFADICDAVRKTAAEKGLPVPELPVPAPFVTNAPTDIKLSDFGAVILGTGYRPDYTSWVRCLDAFDEMGFPFQEGGSSSIVPGLHFMGVHFQRNRSSATLLGVGDDAEVLAESMTRPRLGKGGP